MVVSAATATGRSRAVPDQATLFFYASALVFLCTIGRPWVGLINLPIRFFLKNRLHLSAPGVATFLLIQAIPLYASALFGYARDRFNPLGRRDRGFLMVFGLASAAVMAGMAFMPLTAATLLAGMVVATCCYLFVYSAESGLLTTLGQQKAMSGRIASVWLFVGAIPGVLSYAFGGILSDWLEKSPAGLAVRILFLAASGLMIAIAAFGLWRPKAVFDSLRDDRMTSATPLADLRRLAGHWPIYPALLAWFLWEFAPGTDTVMQFYIGNELHASDAVFGYFTALFAAGFMPLFLAYGWLCRRFRLRDLLIWGTVVGSIQMIPLLFVRSPLSVELAGLGLGLLGGVCSAAYRDLIIRACPEGLQATMFGLVVALSYVAIRFGDLWGTDLYAHHGGFVTCVWVTTAVYVAIIPVVAWMAPRRLTDLKEGEAVA